MTERENGRCRLLTDSEEKACASFERMIAAQGEMLFGITLFHDTAPRIVRWIQGRAYRETLNRMNSAIAQANALVSEVRAGKQPYRALDTFSWPPWTSDMQQRIAIMGFVRDIPMEADHPTRRTINEIQSHFGLLQKKPILALWGADDPVFTVETFLAGWREFFPHIEEHIFEHAGHYVVEDAHEKMLPIVLKFLDHTYLPH